MGWGGVGWGGVGWGGRSDLGFMVPSCGLIGVLKVWDLGFKVYGLGL